MSGTTITKNTMTASLARIQQQLLELPAQAFDTWLANTPVRTGNARRRTKLQANVIRADYGYAVPLDQGRSRQAPQGMSTPTERRIARELRRIMRK